MGPGPLEACRREREGGSKREGEGGRKREGEREGGGGGGEG